MSISETNPSEGCTETLTQAHAVERLIVPKDKDIGGLMVRRALPYAKRRMVGPWVFFDHMGPAELPPGKGIDVRPHPHINLATVTYLFSGEIMHRDSLGSDLPIRPGAVNLMVAGKGITHSERTPDRTRKEGHRLEGLQLWLALPDEDEETAAAFYHHSAAEMPAFTHEGCEVRVMMGNAYGKASPVKCHSPTLFCEAGMPAGSRLTAPDASERAIYVAHGRVKLNGLEVERHTLAVLAQGKDYAEVTIEAAEDSRIAIIGGDAVGKRFIWWNFVSSREDRIEQAKSDWQNGRFPRIPNDDSEFIPLP